MRRRILVLVAVVLGVIGAAGTASAGGTSWCGGAEQTNVDRPDIVNGLQWHVVYAVAADSPNRFSAQVASVVATDLAGVAGWWRGQDATRGLRFDLAAFDGCTQELGQLDISSITLPRAGGEYQDSVTTVDRVKADLNAAGFGHPDKKYLVFYDGPYNAPSNCGKGVSGQIDGGQDGYAVIFLAACSANPETVGSTVLTVAHEMIHALNALPVPFPNPGPPNACRTTLGGENDLGHPCDSAADIMFPSGSPGDVLSAKFLDVNNDDYYGHSGAWWDVQNSLFLRRLDSADTTPPTGPAAAKITATSVKRNVTFKWPKASDTALLGYRVYTNGALFQTNNDQFFTTKKRKVTLAGPKPKRIIELGVRAIDTSGNLGRLEQIRFKVGVGIVDAAGKLVKDTVAPNSPKLRTAKVLSSGLQLRWRKASDLGGAITGYRVERNKRPFATVSAKSRSLLVPFSRARGTWTVRAIDKAKNLSPRTQSLTIK